MKIYIYGSNTFKKHMNSILSKADLQNISSEINNVKTLEETISNDKLSIYLIDSDKIINKNIITDKLNFLKPKDAVYKSILQDAGIEDICFNSDESLIEYIKIKLENQDDSNEQEPEKKERNMADITQIEEIFEEDILSALDTQATVPPETNNTNELNNIEDIGASDISSIDNISNVTENNELQINSSNIDDVTSLIKELLNNKTLELSIKIKAS